MQRIRIAITLLAMVAVLGWLGALLAPQLSTRQANEASLHLLERETDLLVTHWRSSGAELMARARLLAGGLATERFLLAMAHPAGGGPSPVVHPAPPAPAVAPRKHGEEPPGAGRPDAQVLAQAALSSLPVLAGEQVLLVDREGLVLARQDNRSKKGDLVGHLPLVKEALQHGREGHGLTQLEEGLARTAVCPVTDATGAVLGTAVLLRPVDREMVASLSSLVQGRPVVLLGEGSVLAASLPEGELAELRVQLVELIPRARATFGLERRSRALPLQLGARAPYMLALAEPSGGDRGLSLLLLQPSVVFEPQSVLAPILTHLVEQPTDPLVVTLLGLGLVAILLGWWLVGSGVGAPCQRLVHDLQALGKAPQHHMLTLRDYPDFLKPIAVEAQIAVDVALQQTTPLQVTPVTQQLAARPAAAPAPDLETLLPPGRVLVARGSPAPVSIELVEATSSPQSAPATPEPPPGDARLPLTSLPAQEPPDDVASEARPLVRITTPPLDSLADPPLPARAKKRSAAAPPGAKGTTASRAGKTRTPAGGHRDPGAAEAAEAPADAAVRPTSRARTPGSDQRKRTPPRGKKPE